jgi:cytochrome c
MNTMEITKVVGGLCGALLIFLLLKWSSEIIYHGGHEKIDVAYYLEVETIEAEDEQLVEVPFSELLAMADVSKGKKTFGKCKACHKLEDGVNGTGPHLYAIVGRKQGSVDGFKYSSILGSFDGDWSEPELNAFLLKPSEYAPGTKMSYAGLKGETDRANLIAYLKTIKD